MALWGPSDHFVKHYVGHGFVLLQNLTSLCVLEGLTTSVAIHYGFSMGSNPEEGETCLDRLPQEILLQVMPYLDTSTLKTIRLICKSLRHLPNQELFKTFYLYPHRPSFEELLKLTQTDAIRGCVRTLIYDIRFFDVYDLVYQRIDQSGSMFQIGVEPESWLKDLLVKADTQDLLLLYFKRALLGLPALKRIRLVDLFHPFSMRANLKDLRQPAEVPEYYHKTVTDIWGPVLPGFSDFHYGNASAESFQPAAVASCILEAARCSSLPLIELDLNGLTSTDLFKGTPIERITPTYGTLLANLKVLSLDFGCLPRRRERASLCRLPVLLSLCTNLVRLSLEFGAIGRNSNSIDSCSPYIKESLMDDLFPGSTSTGDRKLIYSPKLRIFDLRGFRCREGELKGILQETIDLPCPNFTCFCSWDITLLPETVDGPRACLVRFIKFLRRMQLTLARMAGTLTNCGNQDWEALPPPEEEMLSDRVHAYTERCGNYEDEDAECPLEFAAVPDGEYDVIVPVEDTEENKKWRGDESWEMGGSSWKGGSFWVPVGLMQYMAAGQDP